MCAWMCVMIEGKQSRKSKEQRNKEIGNGQARVLRNKELPIIQYSVGSNQFMKLACIRSSDLREGTN